MSDTANTPEVEELDNQNPEGVSDTDTGDNDEWVAPTREEWDAFLAKKRKADSEAAERKKFLRENGIDHKTGKALQAATDGPVSDAPAEGATDPRAAARAAVEAERAAFSKAQGILTALAEAGVPANRLGAVSRLVDATAVHVDEDGLDGMDEQITSLQAEFPEFFRKPRKAPNPAAAGAGNKAAEPSSANKHWADQFRDQFLGN